MTRRMYHRLYARRQRAAELNELRQSAQSCPRRFGRFGICGGALETVVLPGGTWTIVCERCRRFEAGQCMECGLPVAGMVRKARRCAYHTHLAHKRMVAKYRDEHRAVVNRRARLAARRNAKRNADYKRLWRQANPEKVAAQKRRYYLRQPQNCYAYHRAYRWIPRGRFEEDWTLDRYCVTCGTQPVYGRQKKCNKCKAVGRIGALRIMGKAV